MQYVCLNNEIRMPILGYGVGQLKAGECERCVLDAISVGYRSIDTAQIYGNEAEVGKALAKCGIPRENLFLTTKVWISGTGYENARTSIERSLNNLQTSYLDMVLIHQPFGDYYGAYRAMEEAYTEGWIKVIGVSNFYPERLIDLCRFTDIPPMVNQVQTNVFQQQRSAIPYMSKYQVQHEAWALAEKTNDIFQNTVLNEIGAKYRKTAIQIALRYLVQNNIVVISSATSKEQMQRNFSILDFQLTAEDMTRIAALDQDGQTAYVHYDPALVERLTSMVI